MTIESFQSVKNARGHADPVVLSALSKFEQHLCRTHLRVEIMGERGRKVAVLLTGKKTQGNIEIMLQNRKSSSTCTYLSARSGYTTFFRGSDCIR